MKEKYESFRQDTEGKAEGKCYDESTKKVFSKQKGGKSMANEQQTRKNPEQQTRILPKNFRQIGEPGTKKIYMEDYVYTYLNKLAQPGNIYARGAVLFGNVYKTAAGNCLFISGAAACQNFELDLENSVFTEENWNEIYRIRDHFFPDREIVGWFLSRMGFSVELNDKIIRTHMDNFNGENKVLYMIDALENEDAFYQFENYSLKKQKGYYIYYETNQEMKNYMLAEGEQEQRPEGKRESTTILRDSAVVKNYKKAMKKKKSLRKKTAPGFGMASVASVLVMLLVLLYGVRSVQQFRQGERAEEVFYQQQEQPEDNRQPGQSEDDRQEEYTTGTELREDTAAEEKSMEGLPTEETMGNGIRAEENSFSEEDGQMEREQSSEDESTDDVETGANIFTQEEPDDVTEAWSYIGKQYTVQQGDTLAGISKKIYQSYAYVDALAKANQIENLDQIYPGQVLDVPPMED